MKDDKMIEKDYEKQLSLFDSTIEFMVEKLVKTKKDDRRTKAKIMAECMMTAMFLCDSRIFNDNSLAKDAKEKIDEIKKGHYML